MISYIRGHDSELCGGGIVATLLKCYAAQKQVPPLNVPVSTKFWKLPIFLKHQYYFTRHGKYYVTHLIGFF